MGSGRLPRVAAGITATALLGTTVAAMAVVGGNDARAQEATQERHASTVWWAPDSKPRVSVGSVMAAKGCDDFRSVVIKKRRPGRDRKMGSGVSNRQNNWKIRHKKLRNGTYYVVVRKKEFTRSDGTLVICERDRSPNERR